MTRVLSELLGVTEPAFRLGLRQMEQAAGMPNADIRLSTEILHGTQAKLRELNLDPHDTRGEELYALLGERLKEDEKRLAKALKGKSTKSGSDPIAHVALAMQKNISPKICFALKNTVAKRLLKANLPKKTMKALGYRSADSMLKHESIARLYAAASLIESDAWFKKQLTSYTKLKASDFEIRDITIEHPVSKRWLGLAESVVAKKKHNIFAFKELGSVVLLPLPKDHPALPTLTASILTLHGINEILSASTYMKLHQVQPHFGSMVREAVQGELTLSATLLDQPVSWNMVQYYYARFKESLRSELFEPVVQADDLAWQSIEHVLAKIEPSLRFWLGTSHLAHLENGQVVSWNITDQVLSHCNRLDYEKRSLQHFRSALTTELSVRYMNVKSIEAAITSRFQKQLATEPVVA